MSWYIEKYWTFQRFLGKFGNIENFKDFLGYSGRGIISTIKLKAAIRLLSIPTHKILDKAGSRCQKQNKNTFVMANIRHAL